MEEIKKGRPRSEETIARDQSIVKILSTEGPLTRNALADRLGITRSLTSIAINRLKNEDPPRVRRCVDEDGENVWTTAVEEPCP
jgi:ribosomal protein S25